MNLLFLVNSVLLGVGLAMDAFSVSIANALREPHMKTPKACVIAGTFGVFQALMPMIGWFCVREIAEQFRAFQPFIPWIALLLLLFIGGKMVLEGLRGNAEHAVEPVQESAVSVEAAVGVGAFSLFMQGIATSIDALSVGFTIAKYDLPAALTASLIIGVVTFLISYIGIRIGRKFGEMLSSKATVLGGIILIGIGLEIFLTN